MEQGRPEGDATGDDATDEVTATREDADARRELDALRRDREKAERAAAKEAERARRDREKAERTAARDAERAQRDADRRRRDEEKAEQDRLKALRQAEEARERALLDAQRDRERRETEARKEAERAQAERERAARDAAREAGRALREAEKAARDAALAQQRAAREAERARREAARAGTDPAPALTVDAAALPPDLAVLWRVPEPPRRGPRPGLTLDAIADAAVALADAEGIGAVSMARLAESLGFTTMSLYRYVASKDEVVSLMADRASGRPPAVGREVGDWRARLELLVALQQPVLHAHPWLAHAGTVLHAIGPNRLAWMEAMIAALEDTPLGEDEKVAAVGILAHHQLGELTLYASWAERERTVQEATASPYDMDGLLLAVATPDAHPAVRRAASAGAFGAELESSPVSFGTRLVLDGIAALVARAERAGHDGPAGAPGR
ncbi:TetR/AcrR family transcriptional regulator C-terminal domain-containing protein [Cellulomonas fimi]|uniref:Regulatory protein TetR n=1 Tax=Cellulomonas fimi (strain ATCC 484 / DSM 20113 / JCM 1341 / CCUG 24087 / LMG 16345 / NBRC 15513 / NCIMB 8980 / NCTC 7547 / NRS-133) TaxID=590998 RepID=F4H5A0_CELFA|nr:TetR family transcriptional regulator [Cellulomonas fimi]AEE47823.1 regulatory protein TetR [Cellulomonas fimi ATCC 484]NNH06039.1 TetR family transcriptional regulator [Cellulomonas fimi]